MRYTIANQLRSKIRESGLSLREICRRSKLSWTCLQKFVKCEADINMTTYEKVVDALGLKWSQNFNLIPADAPDDYEPEHYIMRPTPTYDCITRTGRKVRGAKKWRKEQSKQTAKRNRDYRERMKAQGGDPFFPLREWATLREAQQKVKK